MPDDADRPGPGESTKRKPYSPGMLLLFGIILLAFAGWCFTEVLVPGHKAETWRQEGKGWYVPMNWALMLGAGAGSIVLFVMAAARSKKGRARAAPAERTSGEPPPAEPPAAESPSSEGPWKPPAEEPPSEP